MDKNELKAIISAHRRDSLGQTDSELASERARALDRYYGRPYGNEIEGFSKVVSRDIAEAVEWALPALVKMFIQSGNIAEFAPVGQEDELLAEQESDYVNHVIMVENNGFYLLYDAFKDALLLKNGYFKHYWEESEKIREYEYTGLSEEQLLFLMQDLSQEGEVIVKEQDVENGQIKVIVKSTIGRVVIEVIPPEEMRVSKRTRSNTQDSPFIEHVTSKTRTSLIEMGMDEDFVYSLPAYGDKDTTDDQRYSRDTVSDESDDDQGVAFDRSMDEIEYCEAYLRVDFDGDGIAELRKVVTVGNQIPDGDDWNEVIDSIPITSITPKRVPHRHVGESIYDELADIQEIKTVLSRQLLDNIYANNHGEIVVNERCNLPDFMQREPGGIKRVTDKDPVDGSFAPLVTPTILDKILPAIEYIDNVRDSRSGINKLTTSTDPDLIKESTKGAYMEASNKASQRLEMIARLFAEGVKDMVLRVHALLIKHQDKPKKVKLNGEYVDINPQEWRERTDLRVQVGIGTGNEEEKRQKLMMLSEFQSQLLPMGLVTPRNAFAMFKDFAKALGFDAPEKYALNPESEEYQQMMANKQPEQNPLAEAEMVKGQFKLQSDQMQAEFKSTIEQMKQAHKSELDMMKMQMDAMQKEYENDRKEAIEIAKLEVKAYLEAKKIDLGKPGMGAEL